MLSHARALLTSATAPTSYIDADARDTRKILHEAAQLLDLTQPVAVMLIAILHCIPDADDPYQLVSDLMDAVAPGSYLAITHPARDQLDVATRAEESLTQSMGQKVTFRSHEEVARFFAGLELLDPGVVPIQDWRPDSLHDIHSAPTAMWGGVARKPLPDPLPLSRWPRMSRGCAASSSARPGLQITVIFRASRESWAHGHHGGARGARAAASVDGVPRGTYDLI